MPVVPGALWLDPAPLAANELRLVAPVPRDIAYVNLSTTRGRLWSGAVPLSSDARGFASGKAVLPRLPAADEPAWITLSSDPRGTGAGTVGWPLAWRDTHPVTLRPERPFRDWLVLDGLPKAEERDAARRRRARVLSAIALGGGAVLEGILLAEGSRGRGIRAWARVVLAIATVVLAFAAIGIVAMWKTGG